MKANVARWTNTGDALNSKLRFPFFEMRMVFDVRKGEQ